ncbi:hypothetical protein LINGRAHAP2_LOCUS6725 [Linum grandiflorum]
MDNCQIMSKQNLETWGIIKESFKIPAKNSTTFIPLAFLISLLPFTSLLFQHLLLHHASNAAAEFLVSALCEINSSSSTPSIMAMIHNTSQTLFILVFLCLGIGHFFNLVNTVIVVRSASLIYSGNEASSWKISRGNTKSGFLLMLIFLLWRVALIWSYGYLWGEANTTGFQVLIGIGDCLGQLMKWVVCTVYYYDCKKRFLEKKVDFEQGLATEAIKQ